nr:hypothetical protein [Lachnospiraceae bacterium]
VKVLNGFGMPAHREAADTGRIAKAVENGHLVIIAVEVSEYYEGVLEDGLHALTVTSVIADAEGMPTQLVICDSNGGGANRIPVETIERALCGDMIVTDIIR